MGPGGTQNRGGPFLRDTGFSPDDLRQPVTGCGADYIREPELGLGLGLGLGLELGLGLGLGLVLGLGLGLG